MEATERPQRRWPFAMVERFNICFGQSQNTLETRNEREKRQMNNALYQQQHRIGERELNCEGTGAAKKNPRIYSEWAEDAVCLRTTFLTQKRLQPER